MIKKKLKLYYKSLVELFFIFLYGKIFLPKTTNNLIKKIKIDNSFFKSFKNKKYQIYIVKNARIYTDNNENLAIIKDNLILPHISFQQVFGILRSSKYNCTLVKGTPSFIKKINDIILTLNRDEGINKPNLQHHVSSLEQDHRNLNVCYRNQTIHYKLFYNQSWQPKTPCY